MILIGDARPLRLVNANSIPPPPPSPPLELTGRDIRRLASPRPWAFLNVDNEVLLVVLVNADQEIPEILSEGASPAWPSLRKVSGPGLRRSADAVHLVTAATWSFR